MKAAAELLPIPTPASAKPPYRVPTMTEIAALRGSNGMTCVSTFSGCGGSCLGFEWAGFLPLYASEFIPAAIETYRANHPVFVDTRDIRQVQAEEILAQTGLKRGELDVLEGSPPCASFSILGKREAEWGQVKRYSGVMQRTDDLFDEYVRLVDGLQPRAFVAENVSGLVQGKAVGYFKRILAAFQACGYVVQAQLLNAAYLGVPQVRKRLLFTGIRSDQGFGPRLLEPLPYVYGVGDAIPWLGQLERAPDDVPRRVIATQTGTGLRALKRPAQTVLTAGGHHGYTEFTFAVQRVPWARVTPAAWEAAPRIEIHPAHDGSGRYLAWHKTECRDLSMLELRRICSFPDDFVQTGTRALQWERLGRAVPPAMMYQLASALARQLQGGGA